MAPVCLSKMHCKQNPHDLVEPDAKNLRLINGYLGPFSHFFICVITIEPIIGRGLALQNDPLNFSLAEDIHVVCQKMVVKKTFKQVANFGHQALFVKQP